MATQGVWCAFRAHYLGHPWRLLGDAAKVAAAAHLLATTTYTWGPVSGPSMMPAWEVWGDGAVTSRLYRRGKGVKVGDLVEFKVPVNEGVAIKRVAGLPGDYVLEGSPDSGRQEMIQVPPGHCWVLGDNIAASRDSRSYGPVPMALISGKVIYRTHQWPLPLHKIRNPFEDP